MHQFVATATIPSASAIFDFSSPAISGCTDSIAGTDTITTNSVNGPWFLNAVSATDVKIAIPKGGAKFSSSALPGCVSKWAHPSAVQLKGNYNTVNTEIVNDKPLSAIGTGCTVSGMKTSVNVVIPPSPGPVPW